MLTLITVLALSFAFLNMRTELHRLRQEIRRIKNQKGVFANIDGQPQFELFVVGGVNYGIDSTDFTGAFLLNVSEFDGIELELNWYDGVTNTRRQASFPITQNNLGLFLSTHYSNNWDKPTSRRLRLQGLDGNVTFGEIEIPYSARLVIPRKHLRKREISDEVIFSIATFSRLSEDVPLPKINYIKSKSQLESRATAGKFGVVYGRLRRLQTRKGLWSKNSTRKEREKVSGAKNETD